MATTTPLSNFQRAVIESIEDPVSTELMTKAVTIVPCGHTFNEDTVVKILARDRLCPLDRRRIERYVPNYTVRDLAETTDSSPLEEESYSAEAETYFLQGKKASETGDMEGAIEFLLEALKLSPRYEKAQAFLEFCLQRVRSPSYDSRDEEEEKQERRTSSDKEAYINLLLHLLEEPAIASSSSLKQLLGEEVEQLINQDGEELSTQSLEKYQWTKRLLIDNKVSLFVVEKLQQLFGSSPLTRTSPEQRVPSSSASASAAAYSASLPRILSPEQRASVPVRLKTETKPSPSVPTMAFGKAKWGEYFGDVGEEPPLPDNIEAILNSPCPFWPSKKVRNTHMLTLIPATIDGKPLTLNLLGELIQNPKTGYKTQYRYYGKSLKNEFGDKFVSSPYWVLMTRYVIPDSRIKLHMEHKRLVRSYAMATSRPYALPKVLEAATCILMEYVRSGNRLYNDNPETWTRCQEEDESTCAADIGKFGASGLLLTCWGGGCDEYGCGAVWQLR